MSLTTVAVYSGRNVILKLNVVVVVSSLSLQIFVNFSEFNMSAKNECVKNYVEILPDLKNCSIPSKKDIYQFCATLTKSYLSKTNITYIVYHAHHHSLTSNFKLLYTAHRVLPSRYNYVVMA